MSAWVTEGSKTNPASGAVLADSGATHIGEYTIHVIGISTILAPCSFQWRNGANDTTLQEQTFSIQANQNVMEDQIKISTQASGERFRIVTTAIVLGVVQVSMLIS